MVRNGDEVGGTPQPSLLDRSGNVVDVVTLGNHDRARKHVAAQYPFPHLQSRRWRVEFVLSRFEVSLAHRVMRQKKRSRATDHPFTLQCPGYSACAPSGIQQDELRFARADR